MIDRCLLQAKTRLRCTHLIKDIHVAGNAPNKVLLQLTKVNDHVPDA